MTIYQYGICKRSFLSSYGLTQYANAIHQEILTIPQPIQQRPQQLQHFLQTISRPNPVKMEDIVFEEENICDLDIANLQRTTLNDALDSIEKKNKPERIAKWPNNTYQDFMELIVEGNIFNNIGDKIIKFFNKHSNLEVSPLPKSTKNGKDYLNQIKSPSINFKEKVVAIYSGNNITLHYHPIFRAIQALLQRPENINGERIFGELYEGDWWLETEKTLAPLNHLLSTILYSDATIFDCLGKTSGHPVFLIFGNLPNWVRNSQNSK
ncbi:27912_t:CDS:2, partial [Gigaspora margarita]